MGSRSVGRLAVLLTVALFLGALRSVAAPTGLPDTLTMPPDIRQLAEAMWERSPTFRRQCARLRAAPQLSVTIHRGIPPPGTHTAAQTTFTRHDGIPVGADVWIGSSGNTVELIAHEIEHIIEQLDQVDLASVQTRRDAGVSRGHGSDADHFETDRAIAIGRLVASEMSRPPTQSATR